MPVRVVGKNADFGISLAAVLGGAVPAGGYPVTANNIIGFEARSSDFSLSIDINVEQSEAYGDDWKTEEIIDAAWSADITAYYGNNDTLGVMGAGAGTSSVESLLLDPASALMLDKRAVNFYPNGRAGATPSAAQPRYSGRCIVTSAALTAPRGGLDGVRIRVQGDGPIIRHISGAVDS